MVSRSGFVLLLLCLVVAIAFSNGQQQRTQSSNTTPGDAAGRSLVINNNCGPTDVDREMMTHIKAKVDYIAGQLSQGCPTGWVSHGKSCYLVIDIPTLEWNAARRNCQKLGGDLAKITSATENQFVYNLLIRQTKRTAWGAWLGLHRKANTKFYWADNSPLTGYTAWSPGEPNSPSSERCGHIFGPSDRRKGKWNDIRCVLNPSAITSAPVVLCQKRST